MALGVSFQPIMYTHNSMPVSGSVITGDNGHIVFIVARESVSGACKPVVVYCTLKHSFLCYLL